MGLLDILLALTALVAVVALAALARQRDATRQAIHERDSAIARLAGDREGLQLLLKEYIDQREEAEEILRTSEERYRILVDNLAVVVFQIDLEGRWSFLNPAWRTVTGWSMADSLGRPALDFQLPGDRARTSAALGHMLRGTLDRAEGMARVVGADGELRWVEVHAIPTRDRLGLITGLTGTLNDVTDRRRATEALRESEAQYRLLAESIDDVVCLQDLDGTALYFSPSTDRTLGYTAAELIGTDVYALAHPDDLPRIAGGAHIAALRGEMPLYEWRCRRNDGSYVWVETHTTVLRDALGRPERMLNVSRSVEKRKLAEEALRQSEERTRALIARAAYGIFRATREGRFLEVNPALSAMLGYDSEADLMRVHIPLDLYADPGERDQWMTRVMFGQPNEAQEASWVRRDGSTIRVRLSIQAARDVYGRLLYFEGIVENVTERHRRDAAARRAERMASLGRTLAGVAHELNNPLAAVSGFAQILLRGRALAAEDRKAVETIHREAKRAARIVKDLLTFSRREESRGRERVDLNGIVQYILDTQRYAMETRGIRTQIELSEVPAFVSADAAQLEQVVLNLVVNARQALEELIDRRDDWRRPGAEGRGAITTGTFTGGVATASAVDAGAMAAPSPSRLPVIHVRTTIRDASVHLELTDNGPGIAAADLPRIWDPFWTTKEEGVGTGLGLSVVHGIVAAHDGTIDVESTIGVGTRFSIRLPRHASARDSDGERDAAAEVMTQELPRADVAERPLDLLIVDDEEALVAMLTRYFAGRGHAVVAASDGAQALRIAEQSSFDAVICDLRMPGLDGVEVILRLQQLPGSAEAQYVLATGDTASHSARDRSSMLSRTVLVHKPYEVEQIRRIVEEGAGDRAR